MFTVNKNPDAAELRSFGRAMLIGFGAFAVLVGASLALRGVSAPRVAVAIVLAAMGVGLCLLSYRSPRLAKPVYVSWMSVVMPIGFVMSMALLTVLFGLLLPVFSIIVRAGDPLRKKLKVGGTYWEDYKPHEPTLERMRRPF